MKNIIYKLITYYRCLFGDYDRQQGTLIYNQVMRKIQDNHIIVRKRI